jgi:hypothetical protein
MPIQITREWIIDLPDDFDNRIEDQKMIFWKTGITVVIAAFRLPDETGKIALLNQIQEKMPNEVFETLVSTKGEIVGLGYTQVDSASIDKNRLSLYTFTASDTSCLQTAFYLDNPDDLPWAKSIWKGILYQPVEENQA